MASFFQSNSWGPTHQRTLHIVPAIHIRHPNWPRPWHTTSRSADRPVVLRYHRNMSQLLLWRALHSACFSWRSSQKTRCSFSCKCYVTQEEVGLLSKSAIQRQKDYLSFLCACHVALNCRVTSKNIRHNLWICLWTCEMRRLNQISHLGTWVEDSTGYVEDATEPTFNSNLPHLPMREIWMDEWINESLWVHIHSIWFGACEMRRLN